MLKGMLMNARFLNVLPQGLWVGRECLTETEYAHTSDIYQLPKTVCVFIWSQILYAALCLCTFFPGYELFAFISHMGASTMSGHYVCHIKKEGR